MLENIAQKVTDKKMTPAQKTELKLGIGKIPEILLDNTDRNRTSPFAFTGNRFEFRAVGSSANCSGFNDSSECFCGSPAYAIQKGRGYHY